MLEVATASGAVGANYTIDLQPVVRVRGTVGDKKLDETFSPSLPISLTQSVLKVSASAPAPIPGATYAPPSPQSHAGRGAQSRAEPEASPASRPRRVKLARFQLAVSTVRGLAIGLLLLTLLILFTKPMKAEARGLVARAPDRLPLRLHRRRRRLDRGRCARDRGADPHPGLREPRDARPYCERPILREPREDGDAYAVEDGGRLYVYRAVPRPAAAARRRRARRTRRRRLPASRRGRRGVPSLVRFGAPTLLLVVAVTSVMAFTSGNTVPVSYAGASNKPVALSQLAPSQCSAHRRSTNQIIDDDERRPPARPRPTSSSAATRRRP